jgi:hypothetical protein
MNGDIREAKAAIKCDLYVLGWASVGLSATLGLCALLGPSALALAGVVGIAVIWKACWSKRRLSKQFWWYCWGGLLVLDIGIALYGTHPWVPGLK